MYKFLLLSAMSLTVLAAHADEVSHPKAVVQNVSSSKLDIANVIYQVESQDVNGITEVKLTYKDSQGGQHIYEYSTVSPGTSG
ncbi:MAG: DUF2790 domain-containing protein [Pseudomonas sp.]